MSSIAGPNQTSTHFNKPSYVGRFQRYTNKLRLLLKRFCRSLDIKLVFFSAFKVRNIFRVKGSVP